MRATLEHKIQPPAHSYRSAGVSKLLSFKHVMYTPYLFPVRNRVCAFDCMVGLFTSSYEIILQTASLGHFKYPYKDITGLLEWESST